MTELGGSMGAFEGQLPEGRGLGDPFPLFRGDVPIEPTATRRAGGAKRPPPTSRPVPSKVRVDPEGRGILLEVPVARDTLAELEDVSGGELLARLRAQGAIERSAVALSMLAHPKRPPGKSGPVWTIIRKTPLGGATMLEIALPNRVVRQFSDAPSGSVVVRLLPTDARRD